MFIFERIVQCCLAEARSHVCADSRALFCQPCPACAMFAARFCNLFSGGLARSTLLIWNSFSLLLFASYFVLSWTPKLLVAGGCETSALYYSVATPLPISILPTAPFLASR